MLAALLLHAASCAAAAASTTPLPTSLATSLTTSLATSLAVSLATTATPTAATATPAANGTALTSSSRVPTVYVPSVAPTTGAAAATGIVRRYRYQGCFLEIDGLNGTAPGARSLQGDTTDEVLPGDMTVAKCLAFCGGGGSGTAYTYAGLEYARECWCGQELAALAAQEPAAQCNLPCDGDSSTLCGGDLRLTVSPPISPLLCHEHVPPLTAQLYMLPSSPAGRPAVMLGMVLAVAALAAVAQLM